MGVPHHDIATRAQALALLGAGVPIQNIIKISGISKSQIYRIQKKAKERGYNSTTSTTLKTEFLDDNPHTGRPKKITKEMEKEILVEIRASRKGREKTSNDLGW